MLLPLCLCCALSLCLSVALLPTLPCFSRALNASLLGLALEQRSAVLVELLCRVPHDDIASAPSSGHVSATNSDRLREHLAAALASLQAVSGDAQASGTSTSTDAAQRELALWLRVTAHVASKLHTQSIASIATLAARSLLHCGERVAVSLEAAKALAFALVGDTEVLQALHAASHGDAAGAGVAEAVKHRRQLCGDMYGHLRRLHLARQVGAGSVETLLREEAVQYRFALRCAHG